MDVRDVDIIKTWVMQGTLQFTRYFFKKQYRRKFVVGRHHIAISSALDGVLRGETKRLIINMPPRYSKTELAVKSFIAEGFAINPMSKFIHLSYSDDLVRNNSKCVQDIIRLPDYDRLFPGRIPTSTNSREWVNASGGGMYAVSSAGQVTGFGAGMVDREDDDTDTMLLDAIEGMSGVSDGSTFGGAIIIDDPIKPDDARSSLIRDKVNQKFETTIRTRVNSRNTPIIIIMQRLDQNDLCGYLMELEPDDWTVLSLPALSTDDKGNEVALWPFKHTVDELHALRSKNTFVFDTQYMQNPKPIEGVMYEQEWHTYDIIPHCNSSKIKNYTDTADEGADYHCSITYVETETANYVLDVIFTQRPMEYTEVATAEAYCKYNVEIANIESNNGGRGFARNVERQCRIMGNNKTKVKWFHQSGNKMTRIFTLSNEVQNITYFPRGWEHLWPEFYRQLSFFMKIGKNDHDDAPDALTGTVEMRPKIKKKNNAIDYLC